ncbi:hypothetical protein C6P40_000192 [Pichia californica]|uniref:Telomerase reverse transcriptase n=1 Tax=Pichia californica TaxID=460514 RepID=A0A9P6WN56_9ASCO|nr:hypothetical protein C6P40_000192 [[Candida] californica]
MYTLENYIKDTVPDYDKSVFLEYASGGYYSVIQELIVNIRIEKCNQETKAQIPTILISKSEICYHEEFINMIVELMITKKISNVLKLGYTDGSTVGSSDKYTFKGFNSALELLKSRPLEIIKNVIGTNAFLKLIFYFNGFWIENNTMIWGYHENKMYEKKPQQLSISLKYMMHKQTTGLKKTNPVILDPWLLLCYIFCYKPSSSNKCDPPKRYRKIFKLIKALISNHKSQMKEYPYIADQICKINTKNFQDHMSLCADKGDVIKFIMTIIYKVIPLECFGTLRNRSLIMRSIPRLINNTIVSRIPITSALKGVKINDIAWVKPRNNYVTEHLINLKDNSNSFASFTANKDLIGNLFLQPKKSSFRLIVKPFKGNKNEIVDYFIYQKRKIRPIMQILQTIRLKNSCSSISDIITKIYQFKKRIMLQNNGILPAIYSFKFDAQSAYDSVPHDIIKSVVSERLDTFTQNDTIHVQSLNLIDKTSRIRTRKSVIVDHISKLSMIKPMNDFQNRRLFKRSKPKIDNHETFTFKKSEIINFVIKNSKNTCFHTKSRSYYRKVGVYQGFPMSALLFNIVYDSLVDDLYMNFPNKKDTVIVRLIDDFLILSTNKINIDIIKKVTARCLEKYNLKINRLKTEFSTTVLTFAGLFLNIKHLICFKQLKNYNNSPMQMSNFRKVYKSLITYLEMRMKNTDLFDFSPYKIL